MRRHIARPSTTTAATTTICGWRGLGPHFLCNCVKNHSSNNAIIYKGHLGENDQIQTSDWLLSLRCLWNTHPRTRRLFFARYHHTIFLDHLIFIVVSFAIISISCFTYLKILNFQICVVLLLFFKVLPLIFFLH